MASENIVRYTAEGLSRIARVVAEDVARGEPWARQDGAALSPTWKVAVTEVGTASLEVTFRLIDRMATKQEAELAPYREVTVLRPL